MVQLENLIPEQFALVARWLTLREVNRWLTSDWRDREVNAGLVAIAVRNRKNRLFLVRCDEQACGLVALADIDHTDKTAMLWYVLGDPALAGRGITTDAVKQLQCCAFRDMELVSLYAWAFDNNVASRRVLQKAGFREAGRIRCAASFEGRQVDRVYYDVVRPDVL